MATAASTSSPSSPLPTTASTLWAQLLNHRGPSKANAAQPHSYAQLTPQDKAGTSTRILLHDTHARLEKFSERANSMFSAIEASKREMVRVREEVESAREKELDTIAQLINRCQASLQKTIGEPLQAREAATMQASLTVVTERLRALEERTYSKLDALTVVECSLMFSHRRRHQIVRSAYSFSKHKTSCRSRSKNSFPKPKPSRAESSSYLRRFTRFSNPCHSISTSRAALSWRRCPKAAGVGAPTTVQVDRSHPLCLPVVRLRRTQSHR